MNDSTKGALLLLIGGIVGTIIGLIANNFGILVFTIAAIILGCLGLLAIGIDKLKKDGLK